MADVRFDAVDDKCGESVHDGRLNAGAAGRSGSDAFTDACAADVKYGINASAGCASL